MNELFNAQLFKQKSPGFTVVECRHKDTGLSGRPLAPEIHPLIKGAPIRAEYRKKDRRSYNNCKM